MKLTILNTSSMGMKWKPKVYQTKKVSPWLLEDENYYILIGTFSRF